ncbi:CaiB/BaiF CoA transferase family protein [Tsukamurella soli]|uniref:CoA transferase n=1 Tax=Tsukamurella soli TaxID=644556 RepID=A0ABP8JKP9_9ACTN
MTVRLPLAGIRVVELGNFIAAPTAGRMLADFGAEVIKIERPGTGDELRSWRLNGGDTSMLYRTINRNKKSITVDLRTKEGRQVVLDLAACSDAVLENFRPGTLERWGIGPDRLWAVNPYLVITRVSAFGQTGPLSARPGFAAVAEAMGGLRELVGEPDRPPSRVGVSIGDSVAGMLAAFGTVVELLDRERATGTDGAARDRVVDVALNEAVLAVTESLLPDHCAHNVERTRTGPRIDGIAPSSAYPCRDGSMVVIAGNGDGIYKRLMALIGRDDLADDPALQSNADRWRERDLLDDAIGDWTVRHDRVDVLPLLEAAGVPAGPIYTAADICADGQFAVRGMVQHLDVETGDGSRRPVAFPGIAPLLGERSLPIRNLGPDLGADNRYVLGELLGRSEEQIVQLTGRKETP